MTVATWVKGRKYTTNDGARFSPPLIVRPTASPLLSLTNLVEVHVLRVIRKQHGVKLDKVRSALDFLEQEFGLSHPLATVKFKTDGVDMFVESLNRIINASRSGQWAMRSVLDSLLKQVEYNHEEAIRFYPVPNTIVIDPSLSFGKPVIVWTGAIASLFDVGEALGYIAEEFGCTVEQAEAAIKYESNFLVA